MVNPKFIIETMKELDYRYWIVTDSNYNKLYEMFQPVSIDDSVKRFEKFIKSAGSGMYRVFIYNTNQRKNNGDPVKDGFQYETMLTDTLKSDEDERNVVMPTPQQPVGFNGIDAMGQIMTQGGIMGGVGLDRYLGEKDRILELQLRIQQLEMEKKYLEEKLERRESELKRDFESKLSSEARIQGIINNVLPTFMNGFMGGANAPMNGIPDTETITKPMENTKDTQTQRIISSVNKLIKLDPNFAENIEKLAALREKSPSTYETAVKMLNSM